MSNLGNSQGFFFKNGEKWVITYSGINGTNYIVAMVVPDNDILKSTSDVKKTTNTVLITAAIILSTMTIIIIVVSIFVIKHLSKKITEPISELNRITQGISNGDLDVEMGNMNPGIPELDIICGKFGNLIKAVRFANNEYFQNNILNAYHNYIEVEKMLRKINNDRGLGVVWNNLGLALKELDEIQNYLIQSEQYFKKAIENAKNLDKKADTTEAKIIFKITLANRLMNIGILYADMGDSRKAIHTYKKSIRLHKKYDNKLGEMKTVGNLGILYMSMN